MKNLVRWSVPGALVLAGHMVWADLSSPIVVDSDMRSSHWATVFTNAVPLTWQWPSESTQAKLEIVGMNCSFETNLTSAVSNMSWQAFASDTPAVEDVYRLTLTFYTNGTQAAEVMTARLAVVKGAFGGTSVDAVANSAAWAKVKENVVVPYDAAWTLSTNAVSSQIVVAKTSGPVQTNVFDDVSG